LRRTPKPFAKGKIAKPTEFGKLVTIQESEHQIITAYEVHDRLRSGPRSSLAADANPRSPAAMAGGRSNIAMRRSNAGVQSVTSGGRGPREMKQSDSRPAARWHSSRPLCGHFFTAK
jgi:hypothetical protein